MAKTRQGKKIIEVRKHYRQVKKKGKIRRVKIREHRRSTP